MSIRSYLRSVSRYWLGALLAGILTAILGTIVVQFTNKPERATSLAVTIHVAEQGIFPTSEKPAIDQLTASTPALPTSPRALAPTGETVDPAMTAEQLKKALDARTPNQSLAFTASLSGPEERVTTVMDTISSKFRAAIGDNALPSYAGVKLTVGSIKVTIEPGAAPIMGTLTWAMVGVAVGLPVAFLYLFLRTFLDDKTRSPEDLQEFIDDAVLTASGLNDMVQSFSQGLLYLPAGPGENVIAVSEIDSETIDLARKLAFATARSGANVVLVDLDLAPHPLGNTQGLADVVGQRATLTDVISPVDGIDVVRVSRPVPSPGEFLTHTGYTQALRELGAIHDWVLVSTGPLTASNAGVLSMKPTDATLLVVRWGTSSCRDVAQVLSLVEVTGVKAAGLALP